MPQFRAEIPEIHTRITRLIAKQVLDDFLKRFKDIPLREFRFIGDSENLLTPGSALDSKGPDSFNRSSADNYVDVELEDVPDEDFGRSFLATNQTHHFIFRCTRSKMDLFPVYQNRKLTLSFKITSSSRVRLKGLVTRISEGMRQSQTLFTHLISYNYDIPVACTTLINMIYQYMQKNHPYEKLTFEDWFKECKTDNLQVAVRQDGGAPTLIYKQNGVNVLSNLSEHEEEPVIQKDSENGVWNIEINMEMFYQSPSSIRASYPPIIHNDFLPEIWFNKPKTYNYMKNAATSSIWVMAQEKFKWNLGYGQPGRGDTGCKEPYFDDWGKALDNTSLVKLLTALVTVDENDLRYFFHPVNDLSDYMFPEAFVGLMKCFPRASFYEGKHFIDIRGYVWNDVIRPECLSYDDQFNIVLDYDLNPRNYYHIVFSLNTDPTTIASEVWEEALCQPLGLILYFGLFNQKYADKLQALYDQFKLDREEGEQICFTREAINDVIKDMIEDGHDFDNGKLYWDLFPMRTHLNYSVIGERG